VLSCGVICVILSLAFLIQYRSLSDRHTHTHTDTRRGHPVSIASHGKKVRISDEQKAKIRIALHSRSDCINIRLKAEDLTGEDLIALTQTQVNRLQKAL